MTYSMASTYTCRKCSTSSTTKNSQCQRPKTTVAHFRPDTHEHQLHPQVTLAAQVLPLEKKPKVLEVTLDKHITFTQYCNNIAVKVQQRNNVLKALAGSTCGCDKKTLLATYQAFGSSILSYCCHFWTPSLKDTNWSQLLRAQISAPENYHWLS